MCLVWDRSAIRSPMSLNQVCILSTPAKINFETPPVNHSSTLSQDFLLNCSMVAFVVVILLQCKIFKYKTILAVEADYQMYTALRAL